MTMLYCSNVHSVDPDHAGENQINTDDSKWFCFQELIASISVNKSLVAAGYIFLS